MPFEPMPDADRRWVKDPCTSPEHDPPGMIVLQESMIWVCPACGHRTPVFVNRPRLTGEGDCPGG